MLRLSHHLGRLNTVSLSLPHKKRRETAALRNFNPAHDRSGSLPEILTCGGHVLDGEIGRRTVIQASKLEAGIIVPFASRQQPGSPGHFACYLRADAPITHRTAAGLFIATPPFSAAARPPCRPRGRRSP